MSIVTKVGDHNVSAVFMQSQLFHVLKGAISLTQVAHEKRKAQLLETMAGPLASLLKEFCEALPTREGDKQLLAYFYNQSFSSFSSSSYSRAWRETICIPTILQTIWRLHTISSIFNKKAATQFIFKKLFFS